ncbi:hypothetical protein H2C83_06950 [Thermoactinomyces sp. AMNI-1]|uniref:Uncharacterized protein n=1 Tax=Thermoactinomyces mirandus TaxID=2756294 RepID=A0A7W1XRN6_9BACL|nr:hypothetical protein [Thermoactinomyces mirandus]
MFDSYKPIVIGMQICDLPHSYDSMYTYYQKVIKGLPGQLAQHGLVSDEPVYVSLAGGTPACNVGLLHAMHQSTDFRSTKTFIYSPRPAKGELQPPAVPVRIDTYLTANELVKNLDELLTGYHYGQVKDLISKLNLPIHEFLKDILTFLDVLLLRRNTRYAEALTKLKTIGHSELKNTAFFQECLGQINKLDKGIQAHDDRQFGWTSCSEFRQVLHEHYWKLVTLYQLEEYNEWAIGMMTFYENLLRIKATHLLGFDRKQPSLTPEEEKVQFHKKLCDLNNRSFNGKREYPIKRGEYQRIISDSAPKSMLCKRHSWVRKLEKIYKQRNNVVHQFGGLTKSDIENVFGESDNWKKLLRQALNREFQIQINENPLDLIHKQLLEWIHKRLVA